MEQKKQEIIEAVISKAWEDASFRRDLLVNPVEAIEKLTGIKVVLPEGKRLIFTDQTDKDNIYVNIPAEPEVDNMELTEEQLEAVAGGGGQRIWGDFANSLFPSLEACLIIQ